MGIKGHWARPCFVDDYGDKFDNIDWGNSMVLHSIPTNDEVQHVASADCICLPVPKMATKAEVYLHRAADGRGPKDKGWKVVEDGGVE